ncbi:ABC transporter transmembrane domain-containing protein [Roseateles chitinivorans]|uniref:ABC transporter transmembrane domain-containing protein n=1 Tax=Roseateles chitinivorans TaxID=2917965 RepID=UPI003D67C7DE
MNANAVVPRILVTKELFDDLGDTGFLFKSAYSENMRANSFDFSWFIPSLIKHRRLLFEVLGISVLLQILALATPLMSQAVMDKVISHHAVDTLHVIFACIVVVTLGECLLSLVRSYVLTHTTNRIDVELGSALFRHLLRLPVSFFERRSVGDITSKVKELDSLRQLLTGTALTLLIDVAFSICYVAILLFYSSKLTLIVAATLPCYFLITFLVSPVLKQRLETRQKRSSEATSTLVETVAAIQTIKASGIESYTERLWDRQLAAQTRANFSASQVANIGNELIATVSKLSTATILLFGVGEVLAGELTLGMYIAFNMLAGRVSQPIMRISHIWLQLQEAGISMAKLADILSEPPDSAESARPTPRLRGDSVT